MLLTAGQALRTLRRLVATSLWSGFGGGNPKYLQSDQHGTTQVAVASDGSAVSRREFDPYGNPVGTAQGVWPDAHAFLNKPHNPDTGLTDVGARQYDPTTGTFISVDPVLDPGSPAQWNAYGYSNNNPVSMSDPTGLYCDGCDFHNGTQVGVNCPPCGNTADVDDHWKIITGNNTDTKKQPSLGGRKIPTFEQLKKTRPGGHGYGDGDTYEDAISDWAKKVCMSPTEDPEFCSVASQHHLLDDKHPTVKMIVGIGLIALVLAPIAAECVASVVCGRIVGGIIDAATPEGAVFGGTTGGLKAADVLSDALRAVCSFVPGTLVLMADGTYKPIDQLQVGDLVQAADPETGESGPRAVVAPLTSDGVKNLVQITIDTDGTAGDQTGTLTVTGNHPFWAPDLYMWISAGDLEAGDLLQTFAGTKVRVTTIRAWTTIQRVHNLNVNNLHTYYVLAGTTPVLVHNSGCDPLFRGPGFQHVLHEHVAGSPGVTSNNTVFRDYLDHDEIGDLIKDTVASTKGRSNSKDPVTGLARDGLVHTKTFEYPVGVTQGSNPENLYTLEVIVNTNGSLRTAFPVK